MSSTCPSKINSAHSPISSSKLLATIRMRRSSGPEQTAKSAMYSTPAEQSYISHDRFSAAQKSNTKRHVSVSMSSITAPTTSTRYPRNRVPSVVKPNSRPTVEQIAMGLHISRTPHLHPATTNPTSEQYSYAHRTSGPPSRSSLKKPYSSTSRSTSTLEVYASPYASISSGTTPETPALSAASTSDTSFPSSTASLPKSFVARLSSRFRPSSRAVLVPPPPATVRTASHVSDARTVTELGLSQSPDPHATLKPRKNERKAVRFSPSTRALT